ncbi:MAG: tetratricopeptide repeat protein [Parafilimonas sp.]
MKHKKLTTLIYLLLLCYFSNAQSTKIYNDPDADFKQAKELYQQQKFSLAYPLFEKLYLDNARQSNIPISVQTEAKYYSIVCRLQLNDQPAVNEAIDFINLEHNAPRIEMMCYQLGEYYYKHQDFDEAISYYEKANIANLSNDEIAMVKFHEAYGYFTMQKFDDAKPLFEAIAQIPSNLNYYDANYYYGYIAFSNKNYAQALTSFKIIEKRPAYQPIIPYYIAEIYYYRGEKDEALAYAESVLQSNNQYYDLQIRELVGHIYFEKGNYKKALPYLEKYVSSTEKVSREDLYELSYCYYDAEQYKKATDGFKELGGKQDTIAQNSMYLLGDAYLKLNNKAGARNAFLFCSLNSSDKQQKEVSKFNYAKLSVELGYTDVALTELKNFINAYPNSEYGNEAKELLVNVLSNTNNYEDALNLIQTLQSQSEIVKKAYPKILYGRAVELINDQQISQADDLLDKLFTVDYNESYITYANFWKGEIAYRNNAYDSTVYYLLIYLKNASTYGEANAMHAHYTLGYAYLRQQDYDDALKNFEQVTTSVTNNSQSLQVDAFLREADCYFMKKQLSKALQMYETVINNQLPSSDYALYQKAVIAGANGEYAQKISLLQSIQSRYPSSTLVADVNMEVANTYLASEQYDAAIKPLNIILASKNSDAFKPQAYLKLGVSFYNLKDNQNALNNFQKLISTYPNAPESDEAVEYVRDIFIDMQKPDDFVSFMQKSGKPVSFSEQDSITFITAQSAYNNHSYDNALQAFNNYLTKFPNGKYFVEANYMTADIYDSRKDFAHAITYYNAVAQNAPNSYAEQSVLEAARISYFELKDYNQAEKFFEQLKSIASNPQNKLESERGLLRCQYKLNQFDSALANAHDLLQQKGIASDDKAMANLIIAKNYQNNNQLNEATDAYKAVVSTGKSEYAAEARYRLAEILYLQKSFKDAEKAGFDVINKAGSYDYWITKAYILLGDVYLKELDYFNAEATLRSVVQNASDATLKQEAQQKLDAVLAEKDKNSKVVQQ